MGLVIGTVNKATKINYESYKSAETELDFDAAILVDEEIAIGATTQAVADMTFTKTKLQYLFLLSDQDITLTFTLGTGTLEIDLIANQPWLWDNVYEDTIPNPFGYNSVSCTAANASGVAANLSIRGGLVA